MVGSKLVGVNNKYQVYIYIYFISSVYKQNIKINYGGKISF